MMAGQPSAPRGGISHWPTEEQTSHGPPQPAGQQRLPWQVPEAHWDPVLQLLPFARGTAWQTPLPVPATQASTPRWQISVQHTEPPPSAGSQRPEPQSSPNWQLEPFGNWHLPRDRQRRPGSWPSQANSGVSETQRPASFGALQRSHTPWQPLSQHTPSTQLPSAQSASVWHACPMSATGSTHWPSPEQRWPGSHCRSQQSWPLTPKAATTHAPEPHSPAAVHSAPSGSRQRARPKQVRPASPQAASGPFGSMATHVPVGPAQTSHSPVHASSQHTPSTQKAL